MSLFIAALGLALVIEGLLYAAFPDQMKRAIALILEMSRDTLRLGALVAAGIGMAILFAALAAS